jgi:predicted Zn-dependent protease with MMP-like domain
LLSLTAARLKIDSTGGRFNDERRVGAAEGRVNVRILAMPYHVSKAAFAELVERALAELPPQFAEVLDEVPVEVRDRSTPALRRRAGIPTNDRRPLLGLYVGISMTERSVELSGTLPDVIYIFQHDIELVSGDEDELIDEVRTTVLHEIGHHFGLDEDDLDELGYG